MKLISIENMEKNEWSKFVDDHSNGTIFQTPEMYLIYENTKNYQPLFIGLVDNHGEILGFLISVVQKEWRGPMSGLTSRCITWGGPLIKEDLNEKNKKDVLNFILKEQTKIVRKKAIYMEFRNRWDTSGIQKYFENYGYEFIGELDILIDLKKGEETLWNEFHRKRRTSVRKAEKEGVTTKFTNSSTDIKKMYYNYIDTYKHAKHPLADESLFQEAQKIFGRKKMITNILAQLDDLVIGSMTLLTYKKIIYAWYLGSQIEYRNKHPNDLLPWIAMKWGIKNNYELFDFMGGGNPIEKYGVRDFKLKFGGTVVNYGRYQNVFQKTKMKVAMTGLKIVKKMK